MNQEDIVEFENRSDGIEDEQLDDGEILEPFNPANIDIISQQGVVGQLVNRIERRYYPNATGYICLDPDFQRSGNVWSVERKSRLVESVLLGIPLPMFYVSARSDGVWDVVDGIQRLGAFRDFILGEQYIQSIHPSTGPKHELKGRGYSLAGLEFLTQLQGKKFVDLPGRQQDVLLECNVQMTIIRPGTPDAVRFNVFKRINTGGSPLTPQEIRHALHQGAATSFLKELAFEPSFLAATCHSIKDTRMEARELILRLLSTKILRWEASKAAKLNIDTLLTTTMLILNFIGGTPEKTRAMLPPFDPMLTLPMLKDFFIRGMQRNQQLFESYAFRRTLPGAKPKTQINKALFEMWGVLLGDLPEAQWVSLLANKDNFLGECRNIYSQVVPTVSGDVDYFIKSISQWSSLTNIVKWRYDTSRYLIEKYSMGVPQNV